MQGRLCWETTSRCMISCATRRSIGKDAILLYERAILLLKRAVLLLIMLPYLVTTDNMLSDVFTKAADKGTFTKMRGHLMNINAALRGEIVKSMQHATGGVWRAEADHQPHVPLLKNLLRWLAHTAIALGIFM